MGFIASLLNVFKSGEEVELEKKDNYQADLIPQLLADHVQLFTLYNEMLELAKKEDYITLRDVLHDFKLAIEVHVMIEDTQLYTYLGIKYKDHETSMVLLKDIQDEMETIIKAIQKFVNKYDNHLIHKRPGEVFVRDLEAVGKVLTKRVELEEKRLYSLYRA